MSKITPDELNSYFSEISEMLLCTEKQKKQFISRLRNDIESFIEENAEADMGEVVAVFGSAHTISRSFMENSDPKALAKKLKIKKYILVALAVALLIYAAFVIISLVDVHGESHGYFEEGIMMIKNQFTGGEIL